MTIVELICEVRYQVSIMLQTILLGTAEMHLIKTRCETIHISLQYRVLDIQNNQLYLLLLIHIRSVTYHIRLTLISYKKSDI